MNVKEIRKSLNLTQTQLAKKLGLGKRGAATISDWETGKKNISKYYKREIEEMKIRIENEVVTRTTEIIEYDLPNILTKSAWIRYRYSGGYNYAVQIIPKLSLENTIAGFEVTIINDISSRHNFKINRETVMLNKLKIQSVNGEIRSIGETKHLYDPIIIFILEKKGHEGMEIITKKDFLDIIKKAL